MICYLLSLGMHEIITYYGKTINRCVIGILPNANISLNVMYVWKVSSPEHIIDGKMHVKNVFIC